MTIAPFTSGVSMMKTEIRSFKWEPVLRVEFSMKRLANRGVSSKKMLLIVIRTSVSLAHTNVILMLFVPIQLVRGIILTFARLNSIPTGSYTCECVGNYLNYTVPAYNETDSKGNLINKYHYCEDIDECASESTYECVINSQSGLHEVPAK